MGTPDSIHSWKPFLPRRAVVMMRAQTALSGPEPVTEISPSPSQPAPAVQITDSLETIAAEVSACTKCRLCETRTKAVPGEGNPRAKLVFVGEGPGEQEDLQGRPFVGKAGLLLDRMIEAMGLKREDTFIMNVVKCRPPGNRNPEPDEIEACSPYLARQLKLLDPTVLVALGKFAAQTLLKTETRISALRGNFHDFKTEEGGRIRLMPTWHPAYLLRNPDSKKEAWADLQAVAKELNIDLPSKSSPKGNT